MNKILLYVIAFLLIAVSTLGYCYKNEMTEKKRLESNHDALITDVETYKTKAGKNAASVLRLELSKSELERYNKDLTQTVSDLNIKISRIQSESTTATSTEYNISTPVRDSIVYRDRDRLIPDTLKRITYDDAWLDLNGTIEKGIFSGNIQSRDTLVQIVHRIPKRFLFFRWGTKAIRQEVVSKNPYSKIVYTEYIELKK